MRGDSALLEIASSVADGEAVDWTAVSALATDERERALISRLKIIASIGEVHRSTDDADHRKSHLRNASIGAASFFLSESAAGSASHAFTSAGMVSPNSGR